MAVSWREEGNDSGTAQYLCIAGPKPAIGLRRSPRASLRTGLFVALCEISRRASYLLRAGTTPSPCRQGPPSPLGYPEASSPLLGLIRGFNLQNALILTMSPEERRLQKEPGASEGLLL